MRQTVEGPSHIAGLRAGVQLTPSRVESPVGIDFTLESREGLPAGRLGAGGTRARQHYGGGD
ncbi:hypothetical protein PHK61_31540 [Actinomycetospora lutea]|uniref:hypothetical protein n=1 Tax=Actinomycetospora lutea TaxID=663604 RepID=UPI0023668611|nr:hypothetical protein [Actinomycetospora lutea]MDD7942950.1 hypothetical protein [Actinomycetospora lutea]